MSSSKLILGAASGGVEETEVLDVEDVFAPHVYVGNGAKRFIDTGIPLGQSYGSGGVDTQGPFSWLEVNGSSDFGYGTGDFTIEIWVWIDSNKNWSEIWDQRTATQSATTASPIIYADSLGYIYFFHSSANRITGSITLDTWQHVAVSRSGSTTKMFVNGTQGDNDYADSTNYVTPASEWSIGGSLERNAYNTQGFISNARAVKGTALYTSNFTPPTSELTAVTNTVLLTAQGSNPLVDNSGNNHTITVNGGAKATSFGPFDAADAGKGGLVWFKNRDANDPHQLYDTNRGVTKRLKTDSTDAEQTSTQGLLNFTASGFVIGTAVTINTGNEDIVSWNFRKAKSFFDCVTYTGTGPGSAANELQVPHNLGVAPALVIIKRSSDTGDWFVYTDAIDGSWDYGYLNQTSAFGNSGNNAATDSVINVGGVLNVAGDTYTAYLFANNDGDGVFGPDSNEDIIKIGTYTGNGSSNGPEVNLGFEPQWVMIKNTSASVGNWNIFDNIRGIPHDKQDKYIGANTSGSEGALYDTLDVKSTGFKINVDYSYVNTDTHKYLYMAIRRPMKVPTDPNDVFSIDDDTTAIPTWYTGWPVDFAFEVQYSGGTKFSYSRLLGGEYLQLDNTSAEATASTVTWDHMEGMGSTQSNGGWINYSWRRAPKYFDEIAYYGTGSAQNVGHSLTVVPEMMWVKNRDSGEDWQVYHTAHGNGAKLILNSDVGVNTNSSLWNYTTPTATTFRVSGNAKVGASGVSYIAYLFSTLSGISKVGSFTGDGTSGRQIDCGFSNGARFILIKSSGTGSWFFWDAEQGIVTGNDPYLQINNVAAQVTSGDNVDPYSSGFIVNGPGNNASGVTYIFYAVAA